MAVPLRRAAGVAALAGLLAGAGPGAPAPRVEIVHPGRGHEVHLSGAAVVAGAGGPVVAWTAQQGHDNVVFAVRAGRGAPVLVNPEGTSVDALHQPPGLAAGARGELYVTWSARKPVPAGGLFASDLMLSRSLDDGATWGAPVRLNEDRPTSHSFEGLAAAPDGAALVAWIEQRDGRAATVLARVGERGTRPASPVRLDAGETCVCCRVDVAAGPGDRVAVLWRKVLPDNVRDMVLALSADGGRAFAPPTLVHADGWTITACPHRGGSVAGDARGRLYAVWYTEAAGGRPDVLFATSGDGRRFSTPRRLHTAAGSIPDHARLAVGADGRGVVVWEDATAVRRRVVMRAFRDGGRTLGPAESLSPALRAWAPAAASAPGGFIIVWHEERFPSITTVVHRVHLDEGAR
jgi:hypothetical protein